MIVEFDRVHKRVDGSEVMLFKSGDIQVAFEGDMDGEWMWDEAHHAVRIRRMYEKEA